MTSDFRIAQIARGHGGHYNDYEVKFDQELPKNHPGLGLPAYLLRPLQRELPGAIVQVRVMGSRSALVRVLLEAPPVLPEPPRTREPFQSPELVRVRRRTGEVAEVEDAKGNCYVLPVGQLPARLRAQAKQLPRLIVKPR